MGVEVLERENVLQVKGCGLSSLKEPEDVIDCGNSGTTLRLLTGLLAGQNFVSFLTGDDSLRKRPMCRVVDPLREMGAEITGRFNDTLAPLSIKGRNISAIAYTLPVASAQVKSAILLASLYASGETVITDPFGTRNHTELMFKYFGAGKQGFKGRTTNVPDDFSSAAFFIVAGLIIPDSVITIKNVGINRTRTGLLDVLKKMGANIEISATDTQIDCYEPIANITIHTSNLKGAGIVEGEIIPRLIDEFPILCIAAAAADGETLIRGAKELRVKESDRIATMAKALRVIGVPVEELEDGIRIEGRERWGGGMCETQKDHRVAMAMRIASLRKDGVIRPDDESCINTSFPGFNHLLDSLIK
jgi:3-phosphoshikimate 1-carboxyvinyltransferase